jgi:hypothetical protein
MLTYRPCVNHDENNAGRGQRGDKSVRVLRRIEVSVNLRSLGHIHHSLRRVSSALHDLGQVFWRTHIDFK